MSNFSFLRTNRTCCFLSALGVLSGCSEGALTQSSQVIAVDASPSDSGLIPDARADSPASASDAGRCDSLLDEFQGLLRANQTTADPCAVDEDCAIVDPALVCSNGSINWVECPIAKATSSLPAFSGDIAKIANRVCPLMCGRNSSSQCKPVHAKCVALRCALIVD